MAIVTDYECADCGLELCDDGRAFVWDSNLNQTRDFMILMSTCHLLNGSKIVGDVSETYCSECDRFLKIYSIRQFHDSISNPCEVVRKGIENYISGLASELDELKQIRKRAKYTITESDGYYTVKSSEWDDFYYSNIFDPEMSKSEVIDEALAEFKKKITEEIERREKSYRRYLDSIYLVIDNSDRAWEDYDPLEKVNCSECGKEIYKYVNREVPCPRCGGHLIGGFPVCCD